MTNNSFRNTMGLASLSALALVMVACGGSSSSSTPATPTNAAPSAPVIVGPTTAITLHPAFYALSAVDPEGDPITFTVTGTGFTGSGNSATLNATAAGAATITVVAKDSKNASSAASNLTVQVAANRAPQFISQPTGQLTGTSNTIAWTNFQVTAQDPDTDDVAYSITGTPTFVDNTAAAVTGATVAINATTGVVAFNGTVPSGKTSVTATFTVQAVDKLPGTTTVLGATATQVVTLTYFNGNLPPVITTSSLPNLPLNHYIPVSQGSTGFPVSATDPNGDALTWSMTTSPNGNGLTLDTTSGNEVKIISGSTFVPLTTTASAITVNLTALDARGLSTTKSFTISPVADSKPTLNSTPYTETVSGVKFFDKSQVKDQVTGRARFYPGAIDWIDGWSGWYYVAGEESHGADALATDAAFSVVGDQAVKGWTARTIFRDAEGDAIDYSVDARSVYVSAPPYLPVGQPFTLTTSVPAGPADVYPILGVGIGFTFSPYDEEFPTIVAGDGTMTWLPVVHADMDDTTDSFDASWYTDNLGYGVFAAPSTWSFTVMGYEKIWKPSTSSYVLLNDPAQAGRIDYSIKVQPNNRPTIGALDTIPGATNPVIGSHYMVVGTTTLPIGGGASVDPTAYGRPSIQEPESRRYDITGTSGVPVGGPFDYSQANTAKPAVWRWLVAMAGGDASKADDVQIYDPDTTTVSGHADAIHAAMGTATVPAVDTTGNVPTISGSSVDFYNPWIHGMTTNRGAFQVNWGPNRTQYLIARITGTASYSFPVSVRDQYERINNKNLGINPIFGTVRFANARIRQLKEGAENAWANGADTTTRYTGRLRSSANEGDNSVNSNAGARYTFSYLPFPSTAAVDETEFGPTPAQATHIFDGSGPASGTTGGSGLFTAASWITLYSVEGPAYGFHQGNPLNDEYGTFNLPSYAQGRISSGGSATSSWQTYSVSGGNPVADAHKSETGLYADTEYRAQVIPSSSPYLFSIFGDKFRTNADDWWGPGDFAPVSAEMTQYNRTIGNAKVADSNPALTGFPIWQTRWWTPNTEPQTNYILASTWYYGKRQGEIDYSSAYAGRSVLVSQGDADVVGTRMRWTYTWPTVITNANLGRTAGPANKYELGDVLQIAVPNMNSQARWFFTGDGNPQGIPVNDPLYGRVQTWGRTGLSGYANFALNGFTPAAADADAINGTPANNQAISSGFLMADTTPFHVVTDSAWSSVEARGTLNVPNRTTFSAGVNYTELSFVGTRGYISNAITGFVTDPALQLGESYMSNNSGSGDQFSTLGMIKLGSGDKVWFTWMKQDLTKKNAWGTWAASLMEPGTYSVSGGNTKVPSFDMTVGAMNDTQAQIAFSSGTLPGVNNAANFGVVSPYNSTFSIWQRSQWAGLANGVSRPSSARLVNPTFNQNIAGQTLDRSVPAFFNAVAPTASRDGGVRDSAVIYGVRLHPGAAAGEAGIEPGSPVLAQWWNLQETNDVALNAATVASGVDAMNDVNVSAFPAVLKGFYNPMVEPANAANWLTVMELKVNFLAGVRYPSSSAALTDTLYKVPATVANVFQMGAALTDPTCTNPGNVVDMGRPVVSPVRFLAINDYKTNYTGSNRMQTKLDLVNSYPTDLSGTGAWSLAGGTTLFNRSNTTLTWQSSVNNQVIPSGYIVELYRLTGDANNTNQPILLGSFRMGHIGAKEATQVFHMPALYTWRQETQAVYFFRVRTMWISGIDMEKAPNKSRFPMAYADFVSSPFVTF